MNIFSFMLPKTESLPPYVTRSVEVPTGHLVDNPEWVKAYHIFRKNEINLAPKRRNRSY